MHACAGASARPEHGRRRRRPRGGVTKLQGGGGARVAGPTRCGRELAGEAAEVSSRAQGEVARELAQQVFD